MSPDNLPVSFSGAPGAYSEAAARRFFGAGATTLTTADLTEALDAVKNGRARAAIVAVENSVTGPFGGLPDALAGRDLVIGGEVVMPLRHCLMAVPGATLEGISTVVSHPSALGQCRDWVARGGLATLSARDTAAAAQELVAIGEEGTAVLGSRTLAELYGLEILAEGISDAIDNVTRFLVLQPSANPVPAAEAERSAVLIGPVEEPRALRTLRISLESLSAKRVRAPFLGARDGRTFLIEFDHPTAQGEDIARRACGNLPFRMIGSWGTRRVG